MSVERRCANCGVEYKSPTKSAYCILCRQLNPSLQELCVFSARSKYGEDSFFGHKVPYCETHQCFDCNNNVPEIKKEKPWKSKHITFINFWFLKVDYNSGGSVLGRCGGGWAYKIGVMGARDCMVIELTFITIRVYFKKQRGNNGNNIKLHN